MNPGPGGMAAGNGPPLNKSCGGMMGPVVGLGGETIGMGAGATGRGFTVVMGGGVTGLKLEGGGLVSIIGCAPCLRGIILGCPMV